MSKAEIDYQVRMTERTSPNGYPIAEVSLDSTKCPEKVPVYLRLKANSMYELDILPLHIETSHLNWAGNSPRGKYLHAAEEAIRDCAFRVLTNGAKPETLAPGREVRGKVDLFWERLGKKEPGNVKYSRNHHQKRKALS